MKHFGRHRHSAVRFALVVTGALAVPLAGVPASAAGVADRPEPGELRGGQVLQAGWWSRLHQEPPENPLLVPPGPPAPAAPAGSLPVAVTAGEPQRISAIEFAPAGEAGAKVTSFVVSFKEHADGQLNTDAAAVLACPVSESFFVADENGRWQHQPDHDCEDRSVEGVRGGDGVWVFDLTPLAVDWLASDRTSAPAVVLVPGVTEPAGQSFQVAFAGPEERGVGLRAKTAGGPGEKSKGSGSGDGEQAGTGSGDASTGSGGSANDDGTGGSGGSVDLGGGGSLDGGGGLGAAPDAGTIPETPASDVGAGEAPEATPVADGAAVDTASVGAGPLPWHAQIPRPALLLVPLMLGLAYLAMVAMGPDAQPTALVRRHGVSRALDRMRILGDQLRSQVPAGLRGRGTR